MRFFPGRIFLAPVSAFLIPASALGGLEFSERSVSPSGQFIIYGGDAGFRGSVSALAERTKADFLSLLRQRDEWKIAILINLQTRAVNLPDTPASELRFSRTEVGLKLQLDVTLSQKIPPAAIERELARVILVEMIYRKQTGVAAGDLFVDPPAWLVDGLLESVSNRDRASQVASLSTLGSLPTVATFLSQRPEILDPTARQLYRAYSFVLIQTLIDSPTGAARLGHYIGNLAFASNDPSADLRAGFPEIRDLDGAWKSKANELKASLDRELLTFSQTNERLNELLASPLWNEQDRPVSLQNVSPARPNPAQRTALRECARKLLLLATTANPLLRSVVQDYQQIADQLALGKTRGASKRLADLKSLRARLAARMNDFDDYLNWFEAAKMETPSGMFEDSLQTAASEFHKPKRRDPLSVYLDAMELEF